MELNIRLRVAALEMRATWFIRVMMGADCQTFRVYSPLSIAIVALA